MVQRPQLSVSTLGHDLAAQPSEDSSAPAKHDGPDTVDWTSPDTVAAHVSAATLEGMQALWRSHAASMDSRGREFAERVYGLHSQALQDVAAMKTYELKPVLNVLNTFTSSVRETVLQIFQDMRGADDMFAQSLYQTSRRTFAQSLRQALEAKDEMSAEKTRTLKAQHQQLLAGQRRAAEVQLQQALQEQRDTTIKELREESKQTLQQAVAAITALVQEGQATLAATPSPPVGHSAFGAPPMMGSGPSMSYAGLSGPLPSGPSERFGGHGGHLHTMSVMGGGGGDGMMTRPGTGRSMAPPSLGHGPATHAPPSSAFTLNMLHALAEQTDGELGSILAHKEMAAELAGTKEALEEMRLRVEELTLALQQEKVDISAWKDKWAEENSKTDGIKRECLQIVIKCEQRVQALQAQHMSELSKRDTILQRSKDTIMRLESRVAELSGQPGEPRLVSYEDPPRAANPTSSLHAIQQQLQQQQHALVGPGSAASSGHPHLSKQITVAATGPGSGWGENAGTARPAVGGLPSRLTQSGASGLLHPAVLAVASGGGGGGGGGVGYRSSATGAALQLTGSSAGA